VIFENQDQVVNAISNGDTILIDKPAGISSFGVVARVRRYLSQKAGKKIKVGHTGTLDPFATGLLILLSGKATKLSNQFLKLDKWYEATLCLGKTSTTGDPEGVITEVNVDRQPSYSDIEKILPDFLGNIKQTVPIFSAVKINGKRAYQLARQGQKVEMPTREIEIYELEVLSYHFPELVIRTHVSSGTYIRTLGEDLGQALGVGAYLTALRRTKVGNFDLNNAKKLTDFDIS
jgi:tRNA pseudouridine synthase B